MPFVFARFGENPHKQRDSMSFRLPDRNILNAITFVHIFGYISTTYTFLVLVISPQKTRLKNQPLIYTCHPHQKRPPYRFFLLLYVIRKPTQILGWFYLTDSNVCLPCLLFDSGKRQTHLIIMGFQKLTFFIWKPQQKVCLL